MEWIMQATIKLKMSPQLQIMRTVLKLWVHCRKHTNLTELHQVCQEEWSNIQEEGTLNQILGEPCEKFMGLTFQETKGGW